jgi:hypothetical protein
MQTTDQPTTSIPTAAPQKTERWENKLGSFFCLLAVLLFGYACLLIENTVLHPPQDLSGKLVYVAGGAIFLSLVTSGIALYLAECLMRLLVWALLALCLGLDCCAFYAIGRTFANGIPGVTAESLEQMAILAVFVLFLVNLFCAFFALILMRVAGMSTDDVF